MNTSRQRKGAPPRIWLAEMRRDITRDRTGLRELPKGKERTAARIAVWALLAALYWIGWGRGLWNAAVALSNLLDGEHLPARSATGAGDLDALFDISRDFGVAIAGGAAILLLLRRAPRVRWRAAVQGFALSPIAIVFGFVAGNVLAFLPHNDYPPLSPSADTGARLLSYASDIAAGPAEEIVLLGLVVIGLRISGYRWWTVFVVATVLRVPFHLYYGPGAVLMAVWPLLMVLLVRRVGLSAIVGAIVAHSLWDFSSELDTPWAWILKAIPAVIGVAFIGLWARRRDAAAAAATSAAPTSGASTGGALTGGAGHAGPPASS